MEDRQTHSTIRVTKENWLKIKTIQESLSAEYGFNVSKEQVMTLLVNKFQTKAQNTFIKFKQNKPI